MTIVGARQYIPAFGQLGSQGRPFSLSFRHVFCDRGMVYSVRRQKTACDTNIVQCAEMILKIDQWLQEIIQPLTNNITDQLERIAHALTSDPHGMQAGIIFG
jgi:hypothetical protein